MTDQLKLNEEIKHLKLLAILKFGEPSLESCKDVEDNNWYIRGQSRFRYYQAGYFMNIKTEKEAWEYLLKKDQL